VDAVARLSVLYEVLVPEFARRRLTDGSLHQLIVVPDGGLSLLPFETLVVEKGEDPKYLLDVGPPVAYAPSVTVLLNLAARAEIPPPQELKPVLAVADPKYPDATNASLGNGQRNVLDELSTKTIYSEEAGSLNRLPYSAKELEAVETAFAANGVKTGKLQQADATEADVRYNLPGRKVVLLSCHGKADQENGNLFGALALTPGPKANSDPADDGFLTLAEIYELDCRGCELAILSACDTNVGPQTKREAVWAVSRGFLVAGARRVIASDWRVDDEASAALVGEFCKGLASRRQGWNALQYASSLQAAKRRLRSQERWQSPYYWGALVLLGPN